MHKHDDERINKFEIEYEMKRKGWWTQPLEGNAQNIAAYKLVPDLQGDPFIVHNHVP